jgi:hypothetical protein
MSENESPDGVENLLPDPYESDFGKIKRTRKEREDDLVIVAKLLARRHTHQQIADHISNLRPYKIGRTQIVYDVKQIQEALKKKHAKAAPAARALDLEIIEHLEKEVMDAWERSKLDTISSKKEFGDKGAAGDGKQTITKEKRDGDPQWIRCMILLMERRAKLLGLDAPAKSVVEANIKAEHGLNLPALQQAYRRRVELDLQMKPVIQIAEVNPPNPPNSSNP